MPIELNGADEATVAPIREALKAPRKTLTLVFPDDDAGTNATGDLFFRNSDGDLERLPIGTTGQVLTVVSGVPAWETPA